MIAIDTNVLLRFLVQDDAKQSAIASRILEDELSSENPGLVTIVATLEIDWVLRSQYGFTTKIVADTLLGLMSSPNLVFEQGDAIEIALAFEHGDLADNILHQTAKAKGCSKTITFDKYFARIEGVELLTCP